MIFPMKNLSKLLAKYVMKLNPVRPAVKENISDTSRVLKTKRGFQAQANHKMDSRPEKESLQAHRSSVKFLHKPANHDRFKALRKTETKQCFVVRKRAANQSFTSEQPIRSSPLASGQLPFHNKQAANQLFTISERRVMSASTKHHARR